MKSLKNKMILLTTMILIITATFSLFMYNITSLIEDEINRYKNKAVNGKVLILTIEKDLNYVSRCSRDLMLGNDYKGNLEKINQRTKNIEQNFILLKKTIVEDNNYKNNMLLLNKAQKTSLEFVHGVQKKMLNLKSNIDSSKEIYLEYKQELAPLAVTSRRYFEQIKKIMDQSFEDISQNLGKNILKDKNFILLANMIASLIVIATIFFIYVISKKQLIIQNNIKRLNRMLSKYVIYSKTDLKGNITEVSDAFCNISKYDRNELIGKPHNIIRHPNMPAKSFKELWETIQNNAVWQSEVENLRKDGSSYWVNAIVSPDYDDMGNKVGYIAVRHDITANKKFELQTSQLIHAEKMASLGEMLGNIAHQWRQPLSIISTSASGLIVESDIGILNHEKLHNKLENIVEHTDYLSKTIDTFKNFIKDKKDLEEVDLIETINNAINIVDTVLKNNHITLKNKIDQNNIIKMILSSDELIQVIINIISNAKDILLERNIANPWTEIQLHYSEDKVLITFEDNAGGIPENIMHKIFEPYFTTKHQSVGTGLGLHMSYKIITESLNGNLYAENTQNGAKFFIELPLKQTII